MFAIKKFVQQKSAFLHFSGTFLLLASCGHHASYEQELVPVTFCNDSSYSVTVHQEHFEGPVLVEKLIPAECILTNVNPSNNHGIGTVFSIEYWHLLENDVWVGGKDPDRQITQNLEAGENYFISIPQPKSLSLQESFIRIVNASGMDLELNCLGVVFYPISGALPVPSNKSGLYSINKIKNTSCFDNGEIKGLVARQGLLTAPYPFPEFTIVNGYIYNFRFDGNEVIQKETERIMLQ